MALLVSNIRWHEEDDAVRGEIAGRLRVRPEEVVGFTLVRKSLDARRRKQTWVGVFRVEVADEDAVLAAVKGIRAWRAKDDLRYGLVDGAPERVASWHHGRVVVVGAGPAGLFAALYLAEAGVPVMLLDRGQPTKPRVKAVNGHWRRKLPLDPENNVLFGEGGAGTFSDGKIYTRRRDGDVGYILRRFVDFGAREEILLEGWAHLGTDKVRQILPVFRQRLIDLGVKVHYGTRMDRVLVENGQVVGVTTSTGDTVACSKVVVAPGHSARDTLRMLVDVGAKAEARPIAVGARIEHPQEVIDQARYGRDRGDLPAASYRLAWHPGGEVKARTFCMCPGGMVVPASNLPDRVVVNGMSFAAQRSYWANSAIIVEVEPAAFGGEGPTAGFDWQDAIEAAAFQVAGSNEAAPAQRVEDLLAGRASTTAPKTSYPLGVVAGDLRGVLPSFILEGMLGAVQHFDTQLPGFLHPEALFIAPETRTTSPIRFLRDEQSQSIGVTGLYPSGEGAGYGGGIVSSALDGIRVARAMVETLA